MLCNIQQFKPGSLLLAALLNPSSLHSPFFKWPTRCRLTSPLSCDKSCAAALPSNWGALQWAVSFPGWCFNHPVNIQSLNRFTIITFSSLLRKVNIVWISYSMHISDSSGPFRDTDGVRSLLNYLRDNSRSPPRVCLLERQYFESIQAPHLRCLHTEEWTHTKDSAYLISMPVSLLYKHFITIKLP